MRRCSPSAPEDAKVTSTAVDGAELRARLAEAHGAGRQCARGAEGGAEKGGARCTLTREKVQELVPYDLAWAATTPHGRTSGAACSVADGPLTGSGTPLLKALGRSRRHGHERRDRHGSRTGSSQGLTPNARREDR